FRHNLGNVHRAGVVTVDHDRPQRDGLLERLPHLGFYESRLLRECIGIQIHLAKLPIRKLGAPASGMLMFRLFGWQTLSRTIHLLKYAIRTLSKQASTQEVD